MGRKQNKIVWQSFQKLDKGAQCIHCKKNYTFPNATKMQGHLLVCFKCPEDIKKQIRADKSKDAFSKPNVGNTSMASDSDSRSSHSQTPTSSPLPPVNMRSFLDFMSDNDIVSFHTIYDRILISLFSHRL